ncbi:MAG: ABC transporter ATP-binding protein [Oculatellaceae cyanobacterium Prado106]|jgi:iron complex transport system ATP-binding protein|nr:ABC transporter ATP-binding protein [Oculatellaceae cyanobacterium Prado106]
MLLHTEHLTGGYRDHPVIHNLHLTLQPGEWLSLIGANGSGKSTLLKLLNRLLIPQQGAVWLDGKAIHSLPAQIVAQTLAWLPQQSIAPAGLTVRQLVSLGRTPYQPWWQWELNADDRDQVETAMAQVQVQQFSNRPVEQLSGGERQRAFLALALAQAPKVLLLDEPTTYLDIHYQLELLELLRRLNREQNLTIITVLHDINLAARYSDRLALLRHGCLWAIGTPVDTLTLENLRQVFDIEAAILQTPVGLQVCPLAPASI